MQEAWVQSLVDLRSCMLKEKKIFLSVWAEATEKSQLGKFSEVALYLRMQSASETVGGDLTAL